MADAAHRLAGLATAAVLTAAPLGAAAGVALAGAPALRATAAGAAPLEDLVTAGSATACVVVLGWLALVVAISATATLTRGRRATRWERTLSPALVRRLVAATVGLTLGAGAAAANAAPAEPGWAAVAFLPAERAAAPLPAERAAAPLPAERAVPAETRERAPGPRARTAPRPRAASAAVPAPASTAVPAAVPPGWSGVSTETAGGTGGTVVVLRGDSLWSLVTAHLTASGDAHPAERTVAAEVQRWWAANRAVIGADPDVLLPGQVLRVPARY
ncbi:hypothetical protein NUM3379_44120 [Kineococcus sp. NUM-3379]